MDRESAIDKQVRELRAENERLRAALKLLDEYFTTGRINGARVDANTAENIIDAALADQGKSDAPLSEVLAKIRAALADQGKG